MQTADRGEGETAASLHQTSATKYKYKHCHQLRAEKLYAIVIKFIEFIAKC